MDRKLISQDRKKYLRSKKRSKIIVFVTQITILISLTALWEILAN